MVVFIEGRMKVTSQNVRNKHNSWVLRGLRALEGKIIITLFMFLEFFLL